MSLKNELEQAQSKNNIIEVFGLGYVGLPLSVKLANSGFKVIGVYTDHNKIERFNNEILFETEQSLKKEFIQCRKSEKICKI